MIRIIPSETDRARPLVHPSGQADGSHSGSWFRLGRRRFRADQASGISVAQRPANVLSARDVRGLIAGSVAVWLIVLIGVESRLFVPFTEVARSADAMRSEDHGPVLGKAYKWLGHVETPGSFGWVIASTQIVCAVLASIALARLTAREAGRRAALCAVGIFMLSGSFGPAGGAFVLADAPGWLVWFLAVDRVSQLRSNPGSTRKEWVVTALACIAAVVIHSHGMLLVPGIALGLALSRPSRWLGLATLGFIAPTLVVVQLPSEHAIASPVLGVDGDAESWHPYPLLQITYAQAVQAFPWIWAMLFIALARGWMGWARGCQSGATEVERLRLGIATVTWGALTLGALGRPVLPQWGLIGLATMLPSLGRDWARVSRRWPGSARLMTGLAASSAIAVVAGSWHARWEETIGSTGFPSSRSVEAEGLRWDYSVYAPSSVDPLRPAPVLLLLHGSSAAGREFLKQTNWADVAETGGFLIVAPDAAPLLWWRPAHWLLNPRIWNGGQHGSDHPRGRIDDVAFFDALLEDVESTWSVDRNRIAIAGHSSGGAMAFRLAAERSDRYAGFVTVAGGCHLTKPSPDDVVPGLVILGTRDLIFPRFGGVCLLPWEIRRSPPVRVVMGRWAEAVGGSRTPCDGEVTDAGARIIKHYGPSPKDRRMTVMLLRDQGHAWPGSTGLQAGRILSPTLDAADSFDATELAWQFLRKYLEASADRCSTDIF